MPCSLDRTGYVRPVHLGCCYFGGQSEAKAKGGLAALPESENALPLPSPPRSAVPSPGPVRRLNGFIHRIDIAPGGPCLHRWFRVSSMTSVNRPSSHSTAARPSTIRTRTASAPSLSSVMDVPLISLTVTVKPPNRPSLLPPTFSCFVRGWRDTTPATTVATPAQTPSPISSHIASSPFLRRSAGHDPRRTAFQHGSPDPPSPQFDAEIGCRDPRDRRTAVISPIFR